jgi:Ser/Thr protein kinase RdoA (MazF antagonist)
MPAPLPVIRSILEPAALAAALAPAYDLGVVTGCVFLRYGLNHTYRLDTEQGPRILRVYTRGWRSPAEIAYELALITCAAEAGLPVASPLRARDGALSVTVAAPEGPRQAAVFTYAPGHTLTYTEVDARAFGRLEARLHQALAGFETRTPRFALDREHLLFGPLAAIGPALAGRPDDRAYLEDLAARIARRLEDLERDGLRWQPCHGDLHLGNVHFTADGRPTVFDFDCCGPGWRAYDVAVFRWASYLHTGADAPWQAFLAGYEESAPLAEPEIQAIPWFVAARHVWLLGLHAADRFGLGPVGPGQLTYALRAIREWDARAL